MCPSSPSLQFSTYPSPYPTYPATLTYFYPSPIHIFVSQSIHLFSSLQLCTFFYPFLLLLCHTSISHHIINVPVPPFTFPCIPTSPHCASTFTLPHASSPFPVSIVPSFPLVLPLNSPPTSLWFRQSGKHIVFPMLLLLSFFLSSEHF